MWGKIVFILLLLGSAACGKAGAAVSEPTTQQPTTLPAFLPSPETPGAFQPAACRFVLPEDVEQGEDVECGYLTVEEKHDSPQGSLIRLAVAIFHPPGGATQPDPVIYLSGGPGVSALEWAGYQYDIFTETVFATGRDLVLFDQRGVGLSQPALDCPGFDRLNLDLLDKQVDGVRVNDDQIGELVMESLLVCRDELEEIADLSAYNSAESAADVNDLRLALGYDEVNLWGGSYGTRLALEVMRRYPEGIRSVVLDAVYPPDVDLYVSAPANFKRALERLFESCAANPVCSQAHPDLRSVFFETVERLNEKPVRGEIENPLNGVTYEAWMDGNMLIGLTFQLLYDSKLRYLLPQQIYAASQGDYSDFDRVRGALIARMGLSSRGMMFSVQCNEEVAFSSLEDFRDAVRRYPEVNGIYENSLVGELTYRTCAAWGAGQAEVAANQPVSSQVYTLVMSGEFDPVTPPKWGYQAAETLENVYVYEYPGLGHGTSVMAGCPREMLKAFWEEPTRAPEEACIEEMLR